MQTNLAAWVKDTDHGREADAILRRCVHCGFCAATCPTYQVLGNELDSPRGRIYLIKQVLEGHEPTRATQQHLDQCLTCRNCETTCPSGVQYGHLVDIGRLIVDQKVSRSWSNRLRRWLLRKGLTTSLFSLAMRLGKKFRHRLPAGIQHKVPISRHSGSLPDVTGHTRQVLMLTGCVQPAMMPTIDAATIRVLDAIGIGARLASGASCCGAVNFHLDAQSQALNQMRANIDAWWPLIDSGRVEAIVINASGCGAMVKEYAHHLRHDKAYRDRALQVVKAVKDVAEIIAPEAHQLRARMAPGGRAAFHPPCTIQHWQGLRPLSERLLFDLGFELHPFNDSHLCCGSAGTYSVLNPVMAQTLRDRKLSAIKYTDPPVILSSNMGCIAHLQSGTEIPVRHWIEAVDARLGA